MLAIKKSIAKIQQTLGKNK